MFQFATCDRKMALRFLQELYPEKKTRITEQAEEVKHVLNMVEKDMFRIPDPSMHGPRVAILPGKNWDEQQRRQVLNALQKMVEYITYEKSSIEGGQDGNV